MQAREVRVQRDQRAAIRRWITIPAFTSPISAMNSPMPIPIARLRSIGIAFRTASRNAGEHEERDDHALDDDHAHRLAARCSPSAPTSVKATNAFSPRPAARAKG